VTVASTAASPEVASREVSLELIGLSRRFGSVVALDGLTFAVSTIVLLLVVAAAVVIPAIVAHTAKPQRVGIVGGQTAAMTGIVREAGRLVGTGVTVVPQPSLAAGEAALRSGQLDVVLVNDSEVVVKQVSVADSSGSGGGLPSAIADVAGLSRLLGELPPGAADRGVTLPVRGLSPPSASLSRRLTGLFTVVLVWVLISAYGSQIAMGVGEEKQNRAKPPRQHSGEAA